MVAAFASVTACSSTLDGSRGRTAHFAPSTAPRTRTDTLPETPVPTRHARQALVSLTAAPLLLPRLLLRSSLPRRRSRFPSPCRPRRALHSSDRLALVLFVVLWLVTTCVYQLLPFLVRNRFTDCNTFCIVSATPSCAVFSGGAAPHFPRIIMCRFTESSSNSVLLIY